MKIKLHNWPISKLVSDRSGINLNPTWQRGAAWKEPRKVLLIDSILRGMDIPKVYLRKLADNAAHKHDAVDGQQRIRAIWEFRAENFSLNYFACCYSPSLLIHNIVIINWQNNLLGVFQTHLFIDTRDAIRLSLT